MYKKKALVIGSNSFSGSWFVNLLLSKNYYVYGVTRSLELSEVFLKYKSNKKIKNFKFFKKNLNNKSDLNFIIKLIKKNKIEYVVNFAAQGMVAESWIKPADWFKTNTLSAVNLINNLKDIKLKKYLHISTPEVYGNNLKKKKEDFIYNPTTPYAISRASTDMYLKKLHEHYNFPVLFARAANVFGPHQQLYRIVPKAIFSLLSNVKIPLHGGGLSKRSFIHIDDATKAYYAILTKGSVGNCYHVSTDKFITIKDLVKLISFKLNKNFKQNVLLSKDREGKDHGYYLDTNKIKKELKWKNTTVLNDGIHDTINWIKNNFNKFNLNQINYKHKK